MNRWQPRRPSPTFSTLGTKLGPPIEASSKADAERAAIALYGRPVIVELVVVARFHLTPDINEL